MLNLEVGLPRGCVDAPSAGSYSDLYLCGTSSTASLLWFIFCYRCQCTLESKTAVLCKQCLVTDLENYFLVRKSRSQGCLMISVGEVTIELRLVGGTGLLVPIALYLLN